MDLNAHVVMRFSKPGDVILDIFAGTASLALAVIAIGGDRKYLGCENDVDIQGAVENRLGKALLLRDRTTSDSEVTLARLAAFQNLASSVRSFLLPEHNIPSTLLNGKALVTGGPQGNLDWSPEQQSSSAFEIKDTHRNVDGCPIGEGLFLRDDAAIIPTSWSFIFLATSCPQVLSRPGILTVSLDTPGYSC